jgi:protein-L-isoaspartate(D-aspartate) O-methyltransferase
MTPLDLEKARENMVKQQLRTWETLDEQVLNLIQNTPRELFVPEAYHHVAYADMQIPLAHGEAMMPPNIEARLLQAVAIQPTDNVLEVGTGSGYLTAVISQAAHHVVSVEIHPDMTETARQKLDELNIHNVTLENGNAANGWEKHAPYDVIIITGSLPALSEKYEYSLNVGGRMFAIVGKSPVMEAVLITRVGENEFTHEFLFETDLPPLQQVTESSSFVL